MVQISDAQQRYTMDRSRRIRKNKDFRRIYSAGRRFRNRAGLLYVMPATGHSTKIGFVTTKRIGHAFARNRARRLMREVYRLHQYELAEGYELILLAGHFLTDVSYKEAERAILALWRHAEVMGRRR